jgi:hypothetical protein
MPIAPAADLQGFELSQVVGAVGATLTATGDSPSHDPGNDPLTAELRGPTPP